MSQKSGPGWVRGTGRRDCPVGYPVKGNEPSNVYYEPGDPGYPQVIPEMCFEDAPTAERVGFTHVKGGAAAAAPAAAAAGFLRQTGGSRACPDGYPIKGNEPSNIFYRPEDPGYAQVIPEVCFKDVSEAEKAGFSRVKVEATKRTEPVAATRREEAGAAAAGAAAGAAAVKAADSVKADAAKAAEPVKAAAEPVKAAEPARVAAPPPPPPPPPPPAPVAESSGGGWMKWLLPLLALAALAAGIWYFTRDDDKKDETPTVAATIAAGAATIQADKTEVSGAVETAKPGVIGSAEALATENPNAVGSAVANVNAAQGSVEAGVANAEASVAAFATASPEAVGSIEAAATGVAGTVEAGVAAAQASVAAQVTEAAGTVEAIATSAAGTVEAAVPGGSPEASPAASPAAAGTIELDAKDIAFVPTEITINASDEPVTIKMKNTGAALHNFSIDSLKIDVDVNPGETVDIVIPAGTAPGTYDFYCNVPGHKEAGMVGTLVVK